VSYILLALSRLRPRSSLDFEWRFQTVQQMKLMAKVSTLFLTFFCIVTIFPEQNARTISAMLTFGLLSVNIDLDCEIAFHKSRSVAEVKLLAMAS
jgi:hypothetical protein